MSGPEERDPSSKDPAAAVKLPSSEPAKADPESPSPTVRDAKDAKDAKDVPEPNGDKKDAAPKEGNGGTPAPSTMADAVQSFAAAQPASASETTPASGAAPAVRPSAPTDPELKPPSMTPVPEITGPAPLPEPPAEASPDAATEGADTKPVPAATMPAPAPDVLVAATVPQEAKVPTDEGPQPEGIHVRYFGRTDVGLVREHNEDNFLVADFDARVRGTDGQIRDCRIGARGTVLAVCDGMGGAAAGEVASQLAVDTIHDVMQSGAPPKDRDDWARRLVHAVEEAGARIFSAAKMDRSRRGMGTTATVAGLIDKVLFVGQVGDSRAYVLRRGELKLITKDQSLVNQLIEAGQLTEEEAEAFEHSNIILQALGTTEQVTVDLTFLELRRGDRIMLCSDGLSGLVHADLIKEVLGSSEDLTEVCNKLIEMANAGGGHDNITVIAAEFAGQALPSPTPEDHPAYQQYPLPPADDAARRSLPPREPAIKSGERKPGADVKGDETPYRSTAGAVMQTREEDPEVPVEGTRWVMLLVVVLLAVIAAAVALALAGPGSDPESQVPVPAAVTNGEEPATDPAHQPVEVRVRTDVVDGELWVDDELQGPLATGDDTVIMLPPGAYRFEARSGGSVAASATVTVRAGVPADVSLSLPSGTGSAVATTTVDAGPARVPDAGPAVAPVRPAVRGDAGPRRVRPPRPPVGEEQPTTTTTTTTTTTGPAGGGGAAGGGGGGGGAGGGGGGGAGGTGTEPPSNPFN